MYGSVTNILIFFTKNDFVLGNNQYIVAISHVQPAELRIQFFKMFR